jgi:hypothetical protein
MKIRGFKLFGIKAAAFAAILAVPLIASAGQDLSGRPTPVAVASGQVDVKPAAPTQEAFVPESPTILAGVMLLLPLGASAIRIIYKNRAARRHIE